jgi:hypothetical protein
MAINYHEKCPAVAQPGRAFGCSSRLIEADHEKQPIGRTIAVTEESQAQIAFGYCQARVDPARGIQLAELLCLWERRLKFEHSFQPTHFPIKYSKYFVRLLKL